jgi:hypothetical protein
MQGLKLCQEGLEAARLQLQQADAQQAAARAEIASKVRLGFKCCGKCARRLGVSCKQWLQLQW